MSKYSLLQSIIETNDTLNEEMKQLRQRLDENKKRVDELKTYTSPSFELKKEETSCSYNVMQIHCVIAFHNGDKLDYDVHAPVLNEKYDNTYNNYKQLYVWINNSIDNTCAVSRVYFNYYCDDIDSSSGFGISCNRYSVMSVTYDFDDTYQKLDNINTLKPKLKTIINFLRQWKSDN